MATTNFVDGTTVVNAAWLNDVDAAVYQAGSGTSGTVNRTALAKFTDIVSVKDFGAVGDGVTDDTAAFNAATMATTAHTGNDDLAMRRLIFVPAGDYKITGSVYVRKGQHLMGAGEGATRIKLDTTTAYGSNIFKLGYGLISGVDTEDAGGLPPEVSELNTYGGPQSFAIFYTAVAGWTIHNVFLTSPGIGFNLSGDSGRVSNFQIDQALTGMYLGGQNILIEKGLFYLPNFGMILNGVCSDITVTDSEFYYCQYLGVQVPNTVTANSISFNDCRFLLNEQFATFLGYVLLQNNGGDLFFNGCSFRNMAGYAVTRTTGIDCSSTFLNCVFDGLKTLSSYAQSTTAQAINILAENVVVMNCLFKNLNDDPITLDGSASAETSVIVNGSVFDNNSGSYAVTVGSTSALAGSYLAMRNNTLQDLIAPTDILTKTGWAVSTDVALTTAASPVATVKGPVCEIAADTTSAAITITLPTTGSTETNIKPKQGDKVTVYDKKGTFATNNLTLARGAATINGAASNYVSSTNGAMLTAIYNAADNDWRVYT